MRGNRDIRVTRDSRASRDVRGISDIRGVSESMPTRATALRDISDIRASRVTRILGILVN
jgi:hypothetical protein